jgi:hypothetical protein
MWVPEYFGTLAYVTNHPEALLRGEYLLRLVLMCRYVGLGFGQLTRCFRSHRSLRLENLALRQQLAVAEAQASPTPDGSG